MKLLRRVPQAGDKIFTWVSDPITEALAEEIAAGDSTGTVWKGFLGPAKEFWRMKTAGELHPEEPLLVWAVLMRWVKVSSVMQALREKGASLDRADRALLLRACEVALTAKETVGGR